MREAFDAPAETPAPDSKDVEWYQYFGPFSILLIYFVVLAFCKLGQGICRRCDRNQQGDSTDAASNNDRWIYDVRTDTMRRQSADLPPSYSSTGLTDLCDNIVVESGSERRRRHRRARITTVDEDEKLPSYLDIIEDGSDKYQKSETNPAFEDDEEEIKTDVIEDDSVSLESERNLPPPPPYRPPNL